MHYSTRSVLYLLLILLLSCNRKADNRISKIDQILTTLSQEKRFNGNILIAEKGNIIYEKSFGYATDSVAPLTSNSIFNIASVSKIVTVIAIMTLEERGLLSLNDTINSYFPQLPYKNILIKNLLTHTSGLPRIQSQPFRKEIEGKGLDNFEIIELLAIIKPELRFETGTDFYYANTNFLILGALVETVSKEPFHKFLEKNIFERAQMEHTFLKEKRVPKTLKEQIVSYYRRPVWLSNSFQSIDTLKENISDNLTFKNVYGPSAIHTTARDLIRLHIALQDEVLLNKSSLEKMYKPFQLKNNNNYSINSRSNYPAVSGMAWRIARDSTDGKIVFHSGGLRGGRSFFMRNLDKDQCIVMLTNNEETDRYNFTFPMKILNNREYELDKISLARTFTNEYLSNGIEGALRKYHTLKNNNVYKPFVAFDFEEIGAELINKKDVEAAVQLFQLYTNAFPDEYSWSVLGDAYLLKGDTIQAKSSFKKSLEKNPEYDYAHRTLKKLAE